MHFPGHHRGLQKATPVRFGRLKVFVLITQPHLPPLVEPAKLLRFCLGPHEVRGWGSHSAPQDRALQFSGLQRSPHAVQGWTLSSSSLEAPYIKRSVIPGVRRKKDHPSSVMLLYVPKPLLESWHPEPWRPPLFSTVMASSGKTKLYKNACRKSPWWEHSHSAFSLERPGGALYSITSVTKQPHSILRATS